MGHVSASIYKEEMEVADYRLMQKSEEKQLTSRYTATLGVSPGCCLDYRGNTSAKLLRVPTPVLSSGSSRRPNEPTHS
jgi:hypothetical protein